MFTVPILFSDWLKATSMIFAFFLCCALNVVFLSFRVLKEIGPPLPSVGTSLRILPDANFWISSIRISELLTQSRTIKNVVSRGSYPCCLTSPLISPPFWICVFIDDSPFSLISGWKSNLLKHFSLPPYTVGVMCMSSGELAI